MSNQSKLGKVLRIVAIVLLGLVSVFHLLGGAGSSCVALGAENYDSMASLSSYKWLYQLFVVLTLAIGVAGIWATVSLAKGKENSYRNAVIVLVVSLVVSGIHMAASEILRGASAPTNMRVFANIFVLGIFLLFRIPAIWQKIDFEREGNLGGAWPAAGVAMIVAGVMTLTVHLWSASTHTFGGFNFADVWHVELTILGWGLVVLGVLVFTSAFVGLPAVIAERASLPIRIKS